MRKCLLPGLWSKVRLNVIVFVNQLVVLKYIVCVWKLKATRKYPSGPRGAKKIVYDLNYSAVTDTKKNFCS